MTKNPAEAQPIIFILNGAEIKNSYYNKCKETNEAGEEQTADLKLVLACAVTVRSKLRQGVLEVRYEKTGKLIVLNNNLKEGASKMSREFYIWQKMHIAISTLCESDRSFKERLEDATISALIQLNDNEPINSQLAEDLNYVLSKTKHNMKGGKLLSIGDEIENSQLVNKMLHILLETNSY
jgi:hypothetical protein